MFLLSLAFSPDSQFFSTSSLTQQIKVLTCEKSILITEGSSAFEMLVTYVLFEKV